MDKRIIDITGAKFGNLRVLKYLRSEHKHPIWLCRCEYEGCGKIVEVNGHTLRSGRRKSCGTCGYTSMRKGHLLKDLRSRKFGRLQPLYVTRKPGMRYVYWHCKCDCGNECDVSSEQLLRGETVSCGCYHKEVLTKWNNDFERWLAREIDRITQRCYIRTVSATIDTAVVESQCAMSGETIIVHSLSGR